MAAGRLETHGRSICGELFGGGVVPSHRGLGVYRALVAARARAAERLGVRYLLTGARETSRPILERLGFEATSAKTCWRLKS